MKTITRLAMIAALVFLSSSAKADHYGWSGSSPRSHLGAAYGHYSSRYGSSMGSLYDGYSHNAGRNFAGYGYDNDGYRHLPARIGLAPVTSRYTNYPVYGTGYRSGYVPGYGNGYNFNSGSCSYNRIGYGSGYYGR